MPDPTRSDSRNIPMELARVKRSTPDTSTVMTALRNGASRLTRREALRLFSTLGLGVAAGCRQEAAPAVRSSAVRERATSRFPQGAIIRTILADVPPSELGKGATLFHEHLQLAFGYYTSPPTSARSGAPTPEDTARFIELVVEELRMAATDGVACVVDAAIGRRSDRELDTLRELAKRSNVHVVVAGGYFQAAYYPATLAAMSESQIADQLIADAAAQQWGAFGEIGTSMKMHPDERKFLRALSQAHLRTGLSIFTHTEHHGCRSCALEQLDLFESQGVKPGRLCIGHLSDITKDQDATSETHKTIARRGAFLGFDTVGRALGGAAAGTPGKLPADFVDVPDRDKVRRVLSVLEAGLEDQGPLASDFSSAFDLKANWGSGFSAALVQFVPKLRHAGVNEATLQKILVDNPRRFLAFVPGPSASKSLWLADPDAGSNSSLPHTKMSAAH